MSEEPYDSPPQPCVMEARRISIQSTMLKTKRRRSRLEDQSRILSWFFWKLKKSGKYIKWIQTSPQRNTSPGWKENAAGVSFCHRDAMNSCDRDLEILTATSACHASTEVVALDKFVFFSALWISLDTTNDTGRFLSSAATEGQVLYHLLAQVGCSTQAMSLLLPLPLFLHQSVKCRLTWPSGKAPSGTRFNSFWITDIHMYMYMYM